MTGGMKRETSGEWIRFHLAPLKDRSKKRLIRKHGEPATVFRLSAGAIARETGETVDRAGDFLADRPECGIVLDRLSACGGGMIAWNDSRYPFLLKECYDPPPVLFYRGDPSLLEGEIVAVVGARKADRGASSWTARIAASLGRAGFVVASGLALGIDGAAHRGALDGGGGTIAVVGTGVDIVYPRFHCRLGEEIAARGLIVSELPPGVEARPFHFPRRNRILAGISSAVLIAQASERSGAAITGRLALESNRDLLVLASPPWDRRFAGNRRFALEGAPVIQDGDDLVVRLGGTPVPETSPAERAGRMLTAAEGEVTRLLDRGAASVDSIGRTIGRPASEVLALLALLEMKGIIEPEGTIGSFRLKR